MTATPPRTVTILVGVRRGRLYMAAFTVLITIIVLIGFGRTFIVPLARGTFERPWFVHVHGALFFTWIALLITQVSLAARRQMRWHRQIGRIGYALVPLMAVAGVVVSVWSTRRDLALGQTDAMRFFFGQLMDMLMFFSFASAALVMRRTPAAHKRLILFATLAILGAAVGRVPVLSLAGDFVAAALVLSIGAYDLMVDGRIRRVSWVGGLLIVAGIFTETPLGATRAWASAGPVVLAALGPK